MEMGNEQVFVGVVVDKDPSSPFETDTKNDGLYLQTEDGQLLQLVKDHPAVQVPVDVVWRRSRALYEPLLGKKVTVEGHRSHSTIFSAIVKEG
jgi:hypothetical protein